MLAERDASDRYKVSFMARKIGDVFSGVIGGLNEFGLFVSLNGTGVTGFIPVRNLGRDFFVYDKKNACFKGRSTGDFFALGAAITIRVQEANAMTGSLIFVPEAAPLQGLPPLREKYQFSKKSPKHQPNDKKYKNKPAKKFTGKPRKKR
jgi:ribonuclease R